MACAASGNGTQPSGKQTVEVRIAELETLCVKALKTLGYKDEEIKILNEVCCSCISNCLARPCSCSCIARSCDGCIALG